jgi:hypothetical protein
MTAAKKAAWRVCHLVATWAATLVGLLAVLMVVKKAVQTVGMLAGQRAA